MFLWLMLVGGHRQAPTKNVVSCNRRQDMFDGVAADWQGRENSAIVEFRELRESVERQDGGQIPRVAKEPEGGNDNQKRAELDQNVRAKIVADDPPQDARDA